MLLSTSSKMVPLLMYAGVLYMYDSALILECIVGAGVQGYSTAIDILPVPRKKTKKLNICHASQV